MSKRSLGRVAVALAGLSVLMPMTPPGAIAAPYLYDDFDSHDFASPDLGGWSKADDVSIRDGWGSHRSVAWAVSDATRSGYLAWTGDALDQGRRYGHVGGYFRINASNPDLPVGMFSLKNDNGFNHFDFFRDEVTGHWKWDLFRGDSATSTMPVEEGRFYYVEAIIDFGGADGTTYAAQVEIDGERQPAIVSRGQVGTTVRAAWFGSSMTAGNDNIRVYDSLSAEVGDSPFTFDGVPRR